MEFSKICHALELLYKKYQNTNEGLLASYIPELAKIDKDLFSISLMFTDGREFHIGDSTKKFTLQSVSKPFTYGLALNLKGEEFVHSKVGFEPSGEAFNSIIELEKDSHKPFNPMINSGAIAISNMILNENELVSFFNKLSLTNLSINQSVYESELSTAHRNRAILNLLRHFEIVDHQMNEGLDLYFKQCSIEVTSKELALMGSVLANKGIHPITKADLLSKYSDKILSLMFTCGMYDTAGSWAYNVGLPAKSGVSGSILVIKPQVFSLCIYSPLINTHGHSVKALKVVEELSKEYNLSIFS